MMFRGVFKDNVIFETGVSERKLCFNFLPKRSWTAQTAGRLGAMPVRQESLAAETQVLEALDEVSPGENN